MTRKCLALRSALFNWRDERTAELFGATVLHNFGGSVVLPMDTITRIIDCAQAGKLATIDNLKREITWRNDLFDKFGQALLDTIHSVFPPPAPDPPAPIPDASSHEIAATPARKLRKPPTCQACFQPGHTSMYLYNAFSISV